MLKFKPYSYSKISLYKTCPRKFKYQYIDKLGKFEDSPALIKGRTIHYLIENSKLNEADYSAEMKQNIKDFPEVLEIRDYFKNSDLGKKYLDDIDKEPIQEFKLGFGLDLEALEYSRERLFNGIIDYICVKSGVLYICDFKSGKYRELRFQDFSQLLYYAIWFFQKYQIKKIVISYIYVEHNLENSIELDIDHLEHYKSELLESISIIERDSEFCEKRTKLCDYCGFQELCFSKDSELIL